MPVRGVIKCGKVYDIARRGACVSGRNADNVLRDLSHAGAWGQCVTVQHDNKTATRLRNNCAREKMWCAVGVLSTPPSKAKRLRFREAKWLWTSKEEKTVHSRMFATNPSSKLTSSRLAASVMTKMNASSWKKDSIAILYELQVGNRILRGLQVVDQAVA